jgi:uncharacterized protein (DUF885 family)
LFEPRHETALFAVLREIRDLRNENLELRGLVNQLETKMADMSAAINAKLDEIATKIETLGTDLATEIAALAAANNNPNTGTPDAAITASLAKMQAMSDRLTALAGTMPTVPATPPAA